MAKYAILRIKGKQYRVEEGQEFLVDLITGPKFDAEVLLVADGDKVQIGKPIVEKAKIDLKIIKELEKGEKIHVKKYKAKSRYKKHIGFTPKFTRLLLTSVKI